jgi:hypothetical protein
VSKREVVALEAILTDPQNSQRTASEVAQLCLDALAGLPKPLRVEEIERVADKVIEAIEGDKPGGIPARVLDAIDARRAKTHRLAVVGQIKYGPQEETRTVILGPFACGSVLDSEEKLRSALERPLSAREAGQHLAWDPAKKIGRGRFMLAPMFWNARDAWDFYRGDAPAQAVVEVARTLPRDIVPVCLCGLKAAHACRWCGEVVQHPCPKHDVGAETHPCRKAA